MDDANGAAGRAYRQMADASVDRGRAGMQGVERSHRVNRCEGL
jgi:hypothetical protein